MIKEKNRTISSLGYEEISNHKLQEIQGGKGILGKLGVVQAGVDFVSGVWAGIKQSAKDHPNA